MTDRLNILAESLQGTSRVLSAKGVNEQAMLQESAIQLLGRFILENVSLKVVDAGGSKEVTERVTKIGLDGEAGACVLKEVGGAAWHSSDGVELVLLTRVANADDWEALPIQLQNYVAQDHMPCHIMLAVQQMKIEDDVRHRHYVLPVFCILSANGGGGLMSYYAFIQREHRERVLKEPDEMKAGAAAMLEPYLRLVAQYIIGSTVKD